MRRNNQKTKIPVCNNYYGSIEEVYISREKGIMVIKFSDFEGNLKTISCELYSQFNWCGELKGEYDPFVERPFTNELNYLTFNMNEVPMKSVLRLVEPKEA